jgi:hypothetical protein
MRPIALGGPFWNRSNKFACDTISPFYNNSFISEIANNLITVGYLVLLYKLGRKIVNLKQTTPAVVYQ